MSGDCSRSPDNGKGSDEKWSYGGYIEEVKPMGFALGLNMRCERKNGVKGDSKACCLSNWEDGVDVYGDGGRQ